MLILSLFTFPLNSTHPISQDKMVFFKSEIVLHCKRNLL